MSAKTDEIFQKVTDRLIAEIESGAGGWTRPWKSVAGQGLPISVDGRPYRGLNVLILGWEAIDQGYSSNTWGTYKAWQAKGAQVRKGEKATLVTLWKPWEKTDKQSGEKERGLFVKAFPVFAAEQCDGAERWIEREVVVDGPEQIEHAEAFFAAVGADVRHGGNSAYYTPAADAIQLPYLDQFHTAAGYYSTAAHEHIHWTGHDSRLKRDLANRFGSEAYAVEELIAELGAAFFSAAYGITQADRSSDHAAYLASWLKVLKADSKALLTVASKAQKALDYLEDVAGVREVAPYDVAAEGSIGEAVLAA